jgi:hypothetical protein
VRYARPTRIARARYASAIGVALLACWVASASAGGPPEPPEPGARLPEGADAAEHWDLAAHFTSGHRLYVRFLITNAGPGDRTALAFGHLVLPDGEIAGFHNGRRAGRWELSEDRRRIRIGSSLLELSESARHFEVDNDKRGIKIHLDFPADDTARAAPGAPGGYQLALLNLATPASGRFWLEGMSAPKTLAGHAVLSHTWFSAAENQLVLRRIDLASLDPAAPIFATELRPPAGEPWSWLVAGTETFASPGGGLELRGQGSRGSDYPIPTQLEARGKNLDARFSLGKTILEVDPLDALPALLRMVYSFGGRPRHLWVEADAEVALKSPAGDAVLRWNGEGLANLVYLDSTPQNER